MSSHLKVTLLRIDEDSDIFCIRLKFLLYIFTFAIQPLFVIFLFLKFSIPHFHAHINKLSKIELLIFLILASLF